METDHNNNFCNPYNQKVLRVTYKYELMGKILSETYIRILKYGESVQDVINYLYEDPCVIDVSIKDITYSGEN